MMPPSSSLAVRVFPRDLHWEVRVPGMPVRLIDSLCTKERAMEHAVELARELARLDRSRVHIVVERHDGSIERIDSSLAA